MLYGEEDTVFFIDAVQQLLMEYDWHMPYSLTGQLSLFISPDFCTLYLCHFGVECRALYETIGESIS